MVNCARFTSFTLHSPLGSAGRTLPACSGNSSNFSCCSAIIVVACSTTPAVTWCPIFSRLLSVRSCEKFSERAGLADGSGSVCPTLSYKDLHTGGAGVFACCLNFSRLLRIAVHELPDLVNELDDQLGYRITGSSLAAQDEGAGREVERGIALEAAIAHDYSQQQQEVA